MRSGQGGIICIEKDTGTDAEIEVVRLYACGMNEYWGIEGKEWGIGF